MSEKVKLSELTGDNRVRLNNSVKDSSYNHLKENIKSLGVMTPITYRIEDNKKIIVDGHQRVSIAKLLKLKEIPAYEVNVNGDNTAAQLSVNMTRVNMRPIDCAVGLKDILEKNPNTTKADLMTLFGKSAKWIDLSISYTNLAKPIMDVITKFPNKTPDQDELLKIASASQERQVYAFKRYLKEEKQTRAELKEQIASTNWAFGWFIRKISGLCDTSSSQFNFIKETVGLKALRKLEKEKEIEHSYSNSLFEDYAQEQFCEDKNFLIELFSETFAGKILSDLPVLETCKQWLTREKVFGSKQAFYKEIKTRTHEKYSDIEITAWDGNVFSPCIDYVVTNKKTVKEDGTIEETKVDVDPFKNYYNKINKFIYPYVLDHCQGLDHEAYMDGVDLNRTLHWLNHIGKMPFIYNISNKGSGQKEFKLFSNDELITYHAKHWFNEYYRSVTYHQLGLLFKSNGLSSIEELCTELYNTNDEFRKDYVSLFNTKILANEFKVIGKKGEMVNSVLTAFKKPVKKIPFQKHIGVISGNMSQGYMKEYEPKKED
tara:strand:+ start:6705 stop:8336 length:1632 start_codon:yes stop_codon:yes gene_type:complete